MGGGKSRALCEEVFDLSFEFPGLKTLVARQRHTSIIETTKRTMMEEVVPPELLPHLKAKQSAGEDWIELPNGSRVHFIGLEDPVRWFSSEIGLLVFDEAHEILEDTVVKLMTRLRQRGMPNKVLVAFNPASPGHWLQKWFILGASQTAHGFSKAELLPSEATSPIGDAEFFFAKATDNPHLPSNYIEQTLGGLPEFLRRRYLEGLWEFAERGFFDAEALAFYNKQVRQPRWVGVTQGCDLRLRESLLREGKTVQADEGPIRLRPDKKGSWAVWETPAREHWKDGLKIPAYRYIVTVDVSSGGSTDYSAIQVFCVETWEQVAEYQAMVDPDLLALEAYRIGRIYNTALVAPEITGGWGMTIIQELHRRLRYPRVYTRPIQDRLTKKWTEKLGWDTNSKTRANMLDTLERVIRERDIALNGERTLTELVSFVRPEKRENREHGRPEAQAGSNDDLVITLAMAVTLATQLPKQLRPLKEEQYTPQFASTGY